MDRKLLFFDIDGTLLAGGIPGYIPDSAIEALKQAQANGHYLFINSGRTYSFMPDLIKEYPFDGYLCGCGTEVIFRGESLFHNRLPDSIRFQTRDLIRETKVCGIFEGHSACFFDDLSTPFPPVQHIKEVYGRAKDASFIRNFEDPDLDFDKFVVFADEHSDCDTFFQVASQNYVCTQKENQGPYTFIEMVPKNCSKATGIDFIASHLHHSLDHCYAFGDSSNDLPMLTHLKNSIAMGNSHPEVLGKTSYVTTPVNRDGIYLALKHFHLI